MEESDTATDKLNGNRRIHKTQPQSGRRGETRTQTHTLLLALSHAYLQTHTHTHRQIFQERYETTLSVSQTVIGPLVLFPRICTMQFPFLADSTAQDHMKTHPHYIKTHSQTWTSILQAWCP